MVPREMGFQPPRIVTREYPWKRRDEGPRDFAPCAVRAAVLAALLRMILVAHLLDCGEAEAGPGRASPDAGEQGAASPEVLQGRLRIAVCLYGRGSSLGDA